MRLLPVILLLLSTTLLAQEWEYRWTPPLARVNGDPILPEEIKTWRIELNTEIIDLPAWSPAWLRPDGTQNPDAVFSPTVFVFEAGPGANPIAINVLDWTELESGFSEKKLAIVAHTSPPGRVEATLMPVIN